MLSRRVFVSAGAAVIVAPSLPLSASPLHAELAIVDHRFAEARAFGRRMQERGVALAGFDGDITRIWLDRLYPLWHSASPPAVAGLTTQQVLFCLEQLAWDHWLRVTQREDYGTCTALAGGRCEPLVSWSIGRRKSSVSRVG
jgi:hypothetical protein